MSSCLQLLEALAAATSHCSLLPYQLWENALLHTAAATAVITGSTAAAATVTADTAGTATAATASTATAAAHVHIQSGVHCPLCKLVKSLTTQTSGIARY